MNNFIEVSRNNSTDLLNLDMVNAFKLCGDNTWNAIFENNGCLTGVASSVVEKILDVRSDFVRITANSERSREGSRKTFVLSVHKICFISEDPYDVEGHYIYEVHNKTMLSSGYWVNQKTYKQLLHTMSGSFVDTTSSSNGKPISLQSQEDKL